MDFGLALLTEGSKLTQLDMTVGTAAYMSPEQIQGIEVDHRSDIWALGCVLYEMVCGQRPFKGVYDKALLYEIVHDQPDALTGVRTGVPVELEWLVGKCLAKDANERYQSAGELLVDLAAQRKQIASGKSAVLKTSVGQTTPGPASAPRPALKQRRATAMSLAVVGLLVLLAVAFVAGTRFTDGPPAIPTYKRLTFRRGTVTSARFAPDGNTIVYSAAWEGGRRELFSTRPESSESRSLNIQDAVASVDYRLSPVARFPAQIHDLKAAIRFLRAKQVEYGYDTKRLAIAGNSAGGHLAALVGVTNGHERLEGKVGDYLDESSDVQAIVSFFGASNFATILRQSTPQGLGVRVPALQLLLGAQPEDGPELAALASPKSHVDKMDPALLLIHGDQDPQMPINQSHELHGKYKEYGLPVQFIVVHGAGHGGKRFGEYFDGPRTGLVTAFLDEHIKSK